MNRNCHQYHYLKTIIISTKCSLTNNISNETNKSQITCSALSGSHKYKKLKVTQKNFCKPLPVLAVLCSSEYFYKTRHYTDGIVGNKLF